MELVIFNDVCLCFCWAVIKFQDYKKSAIWPVGQKVTMREFIADNRLAKWFVQNYDIVGCNPYTCSDINSTTELHLVNKLVPIPIGLDLHSSTEKKNVHAMQVPRHICDQRLDIDQAKATFSPFNTRKLEVLAEFECNFDSTRLGVARQRTRGEICNLIKADHPDTPITQRGSTHILQSELKMTERQRRSAFWLELGKYAFALAPAGFGLDTHR